MREIQRKCKEKELAREHSHPKPMKALWKSQKYENVESKVKAKLQVPARCPVALHGPLPRLPAGSAQSTCPGDTRQGTSICRETMRSSAEPCSVAQGKKCSLPMLLQR